jgi:hypothetical protein
MFVPAMGIERDYTRTCKVRELTNQKFGSISLVKSLGNVAGRGNAF